MESNQTRMPRIKEVSTLYDQAYKLIKEAILSYRLRPGEPLVESKLATELGISKSPVRDALLQLEVEGFVTRIPYKGTFVAEVSLEDIKNIFQVRDVLEGLVIRLATPLLTEQDLEDARKVLAASEVYLAQGNPDLCAKAGSQFHQIFLNKINNPYLVTSLQIFQSHVERVRMHNVRAQVSQRKSINEHRAILALAEKGEAALAEQAMRDHVESVVHEFAVISERSADASPGSPNWNAEISAVPAQLEK